MADWPTHKARSVARKRRRKWLTTDAGKAWLEIEAAKEAAKTPRPKRRGVNG